MGPTGQNTGDDSYVFIPFCQDNMVIATPVNDHYLNLKQKEQPVVFQDFIKDPVIIREKGSGTKKEMDIFLENAGIEPSSLNVVARMNDLEFLYFLPTLPSTCKKQSRFFCFH